MRFEAEYLYQRSVALLTLAETQASIYHTGVVIDKYRIGRKKLCYIGEDAVANLPVGPTYK